MERYRLVILQYAQFNLFFKTCLFPPISIHFTVLTAANLSRRLGLQFLIIIRHDIQPPRLAKGFFLPTLLLHYFIDSTHDTSSDRKY